MVQRSVIQDEPINGHVVGTKIMHDGCAIQIAVKADGQLIHVDLWHNMVDVMSAECTLARNEAEQAHERGEGGMSSTDEFSRAMSLAQSILDRGKGVTLRKVGDGVTVEEAADPKPLRGLPKEIADAIEVAHNLRWSGYITKSEEQQMIDMAERRHLGHRCKCGRRREELDW